MVTWAQDWARDPGAVRCQWYPLYYHTTISHWKTELLSICRVSVCSTWTTRTRVSGYFSNTDWKAAAGRRSTVDGDAARADTVLYGAGCPCPGQIHDPMHHNSSSINRACEFLGVLMHLTVMTSKILSRLWTLSPGKTCFTTSSVPSWGEKNNSFICS